MKKKENDAIVNRLVYSNQKTHGEENYSIRIS